METPETHIRCDLIIKLDKQEIARYMKPPQHAPTAAISKPPTGSGPVSPKFFIN